MYYYPPGYDRNLLDIPEHNSMKESMLEKDLAGDGTNDRRRPDVNRGAGGDKASCVVRGVSQCAAERVFSQTKQPDPHFEDPVGLLKVAHLQSDFPTVMRIFVNNIHQCRKKFVNV